MKEHGGLRNQLKAIRTRLGLSQQELATAAKIARQTIGGIEAELYAPSAAVALRLARALGCRVDEIFWLDDPGATVEAVAAEGSPTGMGRVSLTSVGGRWIAHPLHGAGAFRTEMAPADGLVEADGNGSVVRVRLLDEPETLARTVAIAGCTPVLSLWARSAERWHPGLRVHWTHANSTAALAALARGEVHAAGMHLWDSVTGEFNASFVRRALPGSSVSLVNLGTWEEGFVVASGNPMGISRVSDLARPAISIVNREEGAGSRLLLDNLLAMESIPGTAIKGYEHCARSHQEAAAAVASGSADAAVTTASVASVYGLGFVPLRSVRYDLALLEETLQHEPVRQLMSTLAHRWVRTQLEVLGGYDTSSTGEIISVRG